MELAELRIDVGRRECPNEIQSENSGRTQKMGQITTEKKVNKADCQIWFAEELCCFAPRLF